MSNFNPKLEETIIVDFITSSPTTGAATDADSTPTCAVYEDTTDTAILTPTVVKRTSLTGNYRVPVVCTAANGFEATKSYSVVISATVGSVAAKAIAANFMMRTRAVDDLATPTNITAGTISTVTTLTGHTPQTGDTFAIVNSGTFGNAAIKTDAAAIKTKTDQLTFTTANQVDSTAVTVSDKSGYSLTSDFRIKKNTALNNFTFLMVDSSSNPATGLTITAQRSLDGGALASMANSASEISNGLYKINLAAADTNADFCAYRLSATGAKDRIIAFPTQTE